MVLLRSLLRIATMIGCLVGLSGCLLSDIEESGSLVTGIDTPLNIDAVQIKVEEARVRNSYQTHYIMTYPESGFTFFEVLVSIEGFGTPQATLAWGKENLELVVQGEVQGLSFARWLIVGEDVQYHVGEAFDYRYVFFFQVPERSDYVDSELIISDGPRIRMRSFVGDGGFNAGLDEKSVSLGIGAVSEGENNQASGQYATVSGGSANQASASHTTVGGGNLNQASASHATVGGGQENHATYFYTTVGGGYGNTADGRDATIGGGSRNTASSHRATVGGGIQNVASHADTTIAGGAYNLAAENYATVSGGTRNQATGSGSTVSGGAGNIASNNQSTVGGGLGNQAMGIYAAIGGGQGNVVSGAFATAPGGFLNHVAGDYSFAAGQQAEVQVSHAGVFLFSDSTDAAFVSQRPDEFAVRASGGVRFVSAVSEEGGPAVGVVLPSGGGAWSTLSDRSAKTDLLPADQADILRRLSQLPISTWRYHEQETSIRHIGPIAQDFYTLFGVGEDARYISTVDADGVALAAIQALYERVQEQEAQLQAQAVALADLEARLAAMEIAGQGSQYRVWGIFMALALLWGGLYVRDPWALRKRP